MLQTPRLCQPLLGLQAASAAHPDGCGRLMPWCLTPASVQREKRCTEEQKWKTAPACKQICSPHCVRGFFAGSSVKRERGQCMDTFENSKKIFWQLRDRREDAGWVGTGQPRTLEPSQRRGREGFICIYSFINVSGTGCRGIWSQGVELIDLSAEDKQRDKIRLSSHCPQTVCASVVS